MKWACNNCSECCKDVSRFGLEEKDDGYCINWEDNKCLIYEDRPSICRSSKFTPGVVNKIACNYLMDKAGSDYPRFKIF